MMSVARRHRLGMMGANWRHANGSYGMAFSFTTA
jgi:hypothetical protein